MNHRGYKEVDYHNTNFESNDQSIPNVEKNKNDKTITLLLGKIEKNKKKINFKPINLESWKKNRAPTPDIVYSYLVNNIYK